MKLGVGFWYSFAILGVNHVNNAFHLGVYLAVAAEVEWVERPAPDFEIWLPLISFWVTRFDGAISGLLGRGHPGAVNKAREGIFALLFEAA